MLKRVVCLSTVILCVIIVYSSGWCARDDSKFDSWYDDQNVLAPTFFKTENELYSVGKWREAYDQWLQQAWQGDLYAMATLPALTVTYTDQTWPVPAEFWEHWVLDLLGEAEGSYVLGSQYALITQTRKKGEALAAKKKAEDFFLRSALAGHLPGMYATSLTAEDRRDRPFIPPPTPHVEPLPVRFMPTDTNGEARYWLTRAADAGYWKAAGFLALGYTTPSHGEPDYAQAERYGIIAAKNGFREGALLVAYSYLEGKFHKMNRCEGFYNYAFLADRIHNDGILTEQNKNKQLLIMRGDIKISKDQIVSGNEVCLKDEVIAAGVAESKRLYDAWKARDDEAGLQKKELYDKAKARIPEVKAAYEKVVQADKKK